MKTQSKIALGITAGLVALAAVGYGVIGCATNSLHTSIPTPNRPIASIRIRAYPAGDQRKGAEACQRHGMAIEQFEVNKTYYVDFTPAE